MVIPKYKEKETPSIKELVDWHIWVEVKKFYGVTVEDTEIYKNKVMEDRERYNKVVTYVESKYPKYKNKPLIVREFDNHFKINTHVDGSPLILSKTIID